MPSEIVAVVIVFLQRKCRALVVVLKVRIIGVQQYLVVIQLQESLIRAPARQPVMADLIVPGGHSPLVCLDSPQMVAS